ncbi:MerR family transcriptional regulator [Mycolicibacterium sp. P9-64]|uniref:MerR family transcriptional regulator n=1 Tax=Mycolicibacterium sp. P9-64 TaxID=2024612 RepID=UPI0011EE10BF|nr:MerR family transcriptional regulator [Mycolicibacterium sp. P9-64]KAA0084382.1 MerR family transcriptional regulator [Mycolicibacterium sp. P9-64]
MTTDTTLPSELTIQQVSRHTGLAESALRYYERIGLIDAVPRDASSGHRRYPADLVAAIESLSCLRGSGMSVADIRTYVANTRRGHDAASDQRRLFEAHAARLHDEISRLRLRERYVTAKARMWAARERGDTEAEQQIMPTVIELAGRLLDDEGARRG